MSRPRNNLDELQRKHALPPVSSPTKPATPQTTAGKGKFKPAKSIPTSTPTASTVKRLGSWSTPGFGKAKPSPLKFPSAAHNSISYIDVSSSESIPANASTSSVPSKRLSSGCPEDLFPTLSPKRPKTDHVPGKENVPYSDPKGKGKARAREPPRPPASNCAPPTRITLPKPHTQAYPALQVPKSISSLRKAFEALAPDADLREKSEHELMGVCDTAEDLRRACDKLIGAARSAQEPKDIELLTAISDFLERRAAAGRVELKAVQRGERPPVSVSRRASSVETNIPTGSGTTLTDGESHQAPDSVEYSAPLDIPRTSTPVNHAFADVSSATADDKDAEDDYWGVFASDPFGPPGGPNLGPLAAPATPPATQHVAPATIRAISPAAPPLPAVESTDYTSRPYYRQICDALRNTFGLTSFRPKQLDAVCAVMDGRDVFVLFPTGSGKSLTFQLPAICQNGVTVVVSPLMSLMRDQVQALKKLKVNVAQLSSDISDSERNKVKAQLRSREKPHLIYVTPEQLQMSDYMQSTLHWLYEHGQLMRFVIDEAHCISDWGRRFRDSYTQLTELRKNYPNVPISALTATANAEVEHDIVSRLSIPNCVRLKLSFNRANLDYEVRMKKGHKGCVDEIAATIQTNYPRDTGIIYCHSRDKCEEVAKELRERFQLKAKHYHAALDPRDKLRVQQEWNQGEVLIIVATVAFGMGIDKADVRYVIHYTLPATLANYYQETGRAGRDGKLAHCILFYHWGDATSRIEMIRREDKPDEEKRWIEEDFWNVVRYCSNDVHCRRFQVLDFFGEKFDPALCRDLCNNCRDKTPTVSEDHTEDAIQTIVLFEKLSQTGNMVSRGQMATAMRGGKPKAMVDKGFTTVEGYGSLKHLDAQVAERLVNEMFYRGVLTTVQLKTAGDWSSPYLKLSRNVNKLKRGQMQVILERRDNGKAPRGKTRSKAAANDPATADPAAASIAESSIAGPSTAGLSRSKKTMAPAAAPEPMRSLYRDDPEDPDWQEDDIEDISSPQPPRRMGTRVVPSASQPLNVGLDSDVEEVDSPVLRPQRTVTMIRQQDLVDVSMGDGNAGIEAICREDLFSLRREIEIENAALAELLTDDVISILAVVLPNSRGALAQELEEHGVSLELLGKWEDRMLTICSNFNFTLTQG